MVEVGEGWWRRVEVLSSPWSCPGLVDTGLGSGQLCLEGHGAQVVQGGVTPLPVVPPDVLAKRLNGLGATPPHRVGSQFGLQGREEAFDHGIIPAIAPPTHADPDAVRGQDPLIDGARVVRSPIGVVQQPRPRGASLESMAQRGERELLAPGSPPRPSQ